MAQVQNPNWDNIRKLLLKQMELLSEKSKAVAEKDDVSTTAELCSLTSALCETIRTYGESC